MAASSTCNLSFRRHAGISWPVSLNPVIGTLSIMQEPHLQEVAFSLFRGGQRCVFPYCIFTLPPSFHFWSSQAVVVGSFARQSPCGLTFRFLAQQLLFSLCHLLPVLLFVASCNCLFPPPPPELNNLGHIWEIHFPLEIVADVSPHASSPYIFYLLFSHISFEGSSVNWFPSHLRWA